MALFLIRSVSRNLCHIFSVLHCRLPCDLFAQNNKLWDERNEDFLYMATSTHHVMSKEVENHAFRHKHIFRYLHVLTNHVDKVVEL